MLRRSCLLNSGGYKSWPWPAKLPLKHNSWFHHLDLRTSISQEARAVITKGDLIVVGILLWSFARLVELYDSGAYRHRQSHLIGYPPAIVANEFDFERLESNRRVSRATLDEYRDEVVCARATLTPIEEIIFKY